MNNKYCTLVIALDGSIKIGESQLCSVISTTYDSNAELINNIAHFKCKQCSIPLAILKTKQSFAYNLMF